AKPCALIVALHGHGDNAKNFLACAKSMGEAANCAILSPEGTEKLGEGWFGHSAGTWVCCADGASMPDLCAGMILTAAPTAKLEGLGKGARPKVVLFLGTKDGNFPNWGDHVSNLKSAKVAFSANKVTDLEHATPDRSYLQTAVGWILSARGTEHEENVLPLKPASPED